MSRLVVLVKAKVLPTHTRLVVLPHLKNNLSQEKCLNSATQATYALIWPQKSVDVVGNHCYWILCFAPTFRLQTTGMVWTESVRTEIYCFFSSINVSLTVKKIRNSLQKVPQQFQIDFAAFSPQNLIIKSRKCKLAVLAAAQTCCSEIWPRRSNNGLIGLSWQHNHSNSSSELIFKSSEKQPI